MKTKKLDLTIHQLVYPLGGCSLRAWLGKDDEQCRKGNYTGDGSSLSSPFHCRRKSCDNITHLATSTDACYVESCVKDSNKANLFLVDSQREKVP